MAYNVQFFDEVINDIQEAKIWYKEKREGLEIEFAWMIEDTIEQIIKMPSSYAIRYKTIRIAHPKVFPYNIHFYIDELNNMIVITAIVHNRRNQVYATDRVL
jgi:hypothetical protein